MTLVNAVVNYCQPDPDYRKAKGQSQSHLKTILKSPAHYLSAAKYKMIPSPAMIMGTAVHCAVLEGQETFDSQFIRKPDNIKYTTKAGKEWKEANSEKTILPNDGKEPQWDCVMGMSQALRELDWFSGKSDDYRKFNEVSIYWQEMGIDCKARLDRVIVNDDEVLVLDLKTTDSIAPTKFQSKCVDLGYDFQAAWYSHAAELIYKKPARFVFVAVERNSPHSIDMFEVSSQMLAEARNKNKKALELLKECFENDYFPKKQPQMRLLEYPRWYKPIYDEPCEFQPLF